VAGWDLEGLARDTAGALASGSDGRLRLAHSLPIRWKRRCRTEGVRRRRRRGGGACGRADVRAGGSGGGAGAARCAACASRTAPRAVQRARTARAAAPRWCGSQGPTAGHSTAPGRLGRATQRTTAARLRPPRPPRAVRPLPRPAGPATLDPALAPAHLRHGHGTRMTSRHLRVAPCSPDPARDGSDEEPPPPCRRSEATAAGPQAERPTFRVSAGRLKNFSI
jgi:hypothetical protein